MRYIRSPHRQAIAAAATVAVAAGVVLTTTLAAHAATGCRATYTVTSQWQGGFGARVDLTNLGDPVTSWRLTWSFGAGQTVTTLWNGVVAQSGAQVTVTNAGWNGALGTGGSVSVGFNGSFSGGNPAPADFALNGVTCNGGTTPTSTAPSGPPPASVLDQVATPSRVSTAGAAVQYTWPGTYFEGRFRGTGVGLVLNDSSNDYVVQVDGTTVATLVTPGNTTHWVRNLAAGDHTVRLAKRTESPWGVGVFGGLVADTGGAILAEPAARTRQIEFIGDSWTAGYGDMSTSRDCNSTGGVNRNTNADVSFGALTAKGLNADYQITAWSGLGMVRNYGGQNAGYDFRTYYETDLQALYNSQTWPVPSTWRPQVVVIGLGINDFSTALTSGERWTSVDQLAADYRTAYLAFIAKLRTRYGTGTQIVLTYPDLSYQTTAFATSIQQIVKNRNDAGDARVSALYYDNTALGLDLLGCDWHPSQRDHRILADAVTKHVATLPSTW
ncbi:cellulose binding domain-containing protein [Actinoplanes sp. GCM10030250]|uniref:cellulose binding domain-containing protein n=1 Tax=Actinoplanes sp. GCM10030250 TaxID=3273376 RepID=UPI003620F791